MPRHRGFNLDRFTFGIPHRLFVQYFSQLQRSTDAEPFSFPDEEAMTAWLKDPENAEPSGMVLEEWQRINDICVHGGRHLLRAYDRSPVPYDDEQPLEALAMRLFLDDRSSFDYAWSYYVLQSGATTRVSQYHFPAGEMEFSNDDARSLEWFLKSMFHQQKMGPNCIVQVNRDEDGVVVLVSRGAYMRTFMRWREANVVFETFRPAIEDVMIYEPQDQRLSVRPGFNRDRDLYVRGIARFLAGDQDLGAAALNEPVFDLSPIASGKFDYRGDPNISRVVLREAELTMQVLGKTSLIIRADDVVRTLKEDLPELSLRRGDLRRVKLLFEVRSPQHGRGYPMAVEIEPPVYSDFSVKAHARYIDEYLRNQGVKLT
jgi:hypothetical protein